MPFLRTTGNAPIPSAAQDTLTERYREIMEQCIPGKGNWVMTGFEEAPLYFRGNGDPAIFMEVKLFGSAKPEAYAELTKGLTGAIEEVLSISPERIYINYEETPYWGWNGKNF